MMDGGRIIESGTHEEQHNPERFIAFGRPREGGPDEAGAGSKQHGARRSRENSKRENRIGQEHRKRRSKPTGENRPNA